MGKAHFGFKTVGEKRGQKIREKLVTVEKKILLRRAI